jgi:hypothetical protein
MTLMSRATGAAALHAVLVDELGVANRPHADAAGVGGDRERRAADEPARAVAPCRTLDGHRLSSTEIPTIPYIKQSGVGRDDRTALI